MSISLDVSSFEAPSAEAETVHSKELSLDEIQFERFVEGARRIGDYRALQARFIAFVAGRLGLRSGEITHMRESWVDWSNGMITIPRQQDCDKGRNGGECGACRQSARQYVKHNGITLDGARIELIKQDAITDAIGPVSNRNLRATHEAHLAGAIDAEEFDDRVDDALSMADCPDAWVVFDELDAAAEQYAEEFDVTFEDALGRSWSAKTDAAARDVPFKHDARAQLVLEQFFARWDRWPHSQTAVNRRVDMAAQEADGTDVEDITPHGLRSTAATYVAGRGMKTMALQSMFGWEKIQTARCYISRSGENTRRELEAIHSR